MVSRDDSGAGCVLCGKCLEVCPLLAATGNEELAPRSKARLASVLGRGEDELSERDVADLAGLCLGCGRCVEACSSGVDVPALVARLRAAHAGLKGWLWQGFMTRFAELLPMAARASGAVPERMVPERFSGLLKLARAAGRERVAPFVRLREPGQEHAGREALLFPGCAAQATRFGWTRTAKDVCEAVGLSLIEAEFSCCGAGLGAAGLLEERGAAARRNLELWRGAGGPMVVALCASCLAGLRGYAEDEAIFADADEAARFTASLTPLSGLLNSARFVVSPDAPRVAYHRPCHGPGRDGAAQDPDEALLRAMFGPGLPLSGHCCGFGGILQLAAPDLAAQVAERCWEGLRGDAPRLVLTGCTACVLNLAATAPEGVRAAHWLECLSLD